MDHRLHVTDPGQIEIYTNGFPNRTDSTISFTDGSRTFSIQPTGTAFEFSVQGIIYSSMGDTVVIDNTEGIHVVYYDDAVLTALANPTAAQVDSVIRTKAIVSFIYWDVSAVAAIYVGEERHGNSMSPVTHAYLHFIYGLEYVPPGLGLSDFTVDQDGADDEDAQFAVDAGGVSDEDIYHTISSIVKTTGLPIYYLTGAGADWNKVVNAGFSVRTYDGTTNTRLPYNQYTVGAWQLTEVGNNKYVLCHIFATAEKDTPMVAFVGQAEYANRNAARTGAETEILSLVTNDTLSPEMRPIGTTILKTSDATGNAVNAAIWTTDDGDNYIDWRSTVISRVELTTSDHNSLSGLQGGAVGDYFHFTEVQHDTLTDGSDAEGLHTHLLDIVNLEFDAKDWDTGRPALDNNHVPCFDSGEDQWSYKKLIVISVGGVGVLENSHNLNIGAGSCVIDTSGNITLDGTVDGVNVSDMDARKFYGKNLASELSLPTNKDMLYFDFSANQWKIGYSGLISSGDFTYHYHATDRDRANHTGNPPSFYGTLSANIATDDDWVDMLWNSSTKHDFVHLDGDEAIQVPESGEYMIQVSLVSDYATTDKIHSLRVQAGPEV